MPSRQTRMLPPLWPVHGRDGGPAYSAPRPGDPRLGWVPVVLNQIIDARDEVCPTDLPRIGSRFTSDERPPRRSSPAEDHRAVTAWEQGSPADSRRFEAFRAFLGHEWSYNHCQGRFSTRVRGAVLQLGLAVGPNSAVHRLKRRGGIARHRGVRLHSFAYRPAPIPRRWRMVSPRPRLHPPPQSRPAS